MNHGTDTLPRTIEAIRNGIEQGLHIGAQLYVSQRGQVVADLAVGESREGVAMGADTLMVWMSSTKPIAAVAIAQLWERGKLELDDPVMRHIPEFGNNGKEGITIRHLLTHTAGIRGIAGRWEEQPWEKIIETICAMRMEPGWAPGKKAGYHVATSWYVLAEIVWRRDGRAFERYVREEIFLPIGMRDSWIGMPASAYRAYGDRIGIMHDTLKVRDSRMRPHPSPLPEGEGERRATQASPLHAGEGEESRARSMGYDSEEEAGMVKPGANGRGPIRELGLFYEMMLNCGMARGNRILLPQTVEALVARHRVGLVDQTFKHRIDWGLGFIINSAYYGEATSPYGFGANASMRTFGHSGHQSSSGFADPEHGLVVAWVLNGMPGEKRHDQRLRGIDGAIYEDLGMD